MYNMAKTVLVWNQLQPIPPVVDNSWVSYPQYGIFAPPLVVCELKPSQLYGALPPWPHQVLCPWTSLGTPPQTVVIGWRGVLEIDWFWGQKVKRQGHETQCRREFVHSCECRLRLVIGCRYIRKDSHHNRRRWLQGSTSWLCCDCRARKMMNILKISCWGWTSPRREWFCSTRRSTTNLFHVIAKHRKQPKTFRMFSVCFRQFGQFSLSC